MLIYHVFADHGTESEVLTDYGRVVRVSTDPRDTNDSEPVKADAANFPLSADADLAVLHPPCTRWAEMTKISGDPGVHPDLIPDARRIGRQYAEHYIIENVPRAPLRDPVILDGKMFGLPFVYERAFETTFPVTQPPRYAALTDGGYVSPRFYSDRSKEWWAAAKGYPTCYPKEHLAKNTVPAPYIRYLLRAWMVAAREGAEPANYSTREELDVAARQQENRVLAGFALDAEVGGESHD